MGEFDFEDDFSIAFEFVPIYNKKQNTIFVDNGSLNQIVRGDNHIATKRKNTYRYLVYY